MGQREAALGFLALNEGLSSIMQQLWPQNFSTPLKMTTLKSFCYKIPNYKMVIKIYHKLTRKILKTIYSFKNSSNKPTTYLPIEKSNAFQTEHLVKREAWFALFAHLFECCNITFHAVSGTFHWVLRESESKRPITS